MSEVVSPSPRSPSAGTGSALPTVQLDNRKRGPVTRTRAPKPWARNGACHGGPTNTFFPSRDLATADYQAAKAICVRCPVRPECLAYALTNHESRGIWGGFAEKERRELRKMIRRAKAHRDPDAAVEWVLDYLYPTEPEPTRLPLTTMVRNVSRSSASSVLSEAA